jgi:hypothetical protein
VKEEVPGATGDGADDGNKALHEPCKSGGASGSMQDWGGKERVSFGTNISSDEVMSNGTSVQQEAKLWSDAVERFHARKFRDKHLPNSDKQATIHKVAGAGSIKKQKTPVKPCVKGVIKALMEEEDHAEMNRELIDINKELQEVDHAMDADPLSADPTHLTGAQGEPRQEK